MDKKAIQRKRMERYLIDAAKTIIRDEGADAVTVRKVADLAGYSYTTMYNYFADISELLWYAVADYMEELVAVVEAAEEEAGYGLEGLKEVYRAYIGYYLQNPAVYRFAFFKQLGEPPPDVAARLTSGVLGEKQVKALEACAREGLIAPGDIVTVAEMLTGYVHGLLLFYFSERMQLKQEEMMIKMEAGIDFLLKSK